MKVLIAGDFCPQNRVANHIEEGAFSSLFEEIASVTGQADCSIVNFECPVADSECKPITKCGPHLKCNKSAVEADSKYCRDNNEGSIYGNIIY